MENQKIDTIVKLNNFILSSKDEVEFLGLDKQDAISAKEYIEQLKYLHSLFFLSIKSPYMIITKKNKWVKDIQPNFSHFSESVLDVIDYNGNITPIWKEKGQYVCLPDAKLREEKLCKNSFDELKEIEEITKSPDFSIENNKFQTLSNNFILLFQRFDSFSVQMNLKNFIPENISYEEAEKTIVNDYITYATYLIQNKILRANKDQVVKKLYLKK